MRSSTVTLGLAALLAWTVTAECRAAGRQEVWLINTCRVGGVCCPAIDCSAIDYWRLDGECRWTSADLPTLLAGDDPGMPTTVFIHGMWEDPQQAISMAWQLYQQLKCDAGERSFRLLIWAWPADRQLRRIRADSQLHACRSDTESLLLAQYLDRTKPTVPLNLVGYSFGARVVGGALELLAGGQIAGCCLPQRSTAPRVPVRAMLVGAAMDWDWLLPGHRNGLALSLVERMLVTVNRADPVLKRYPKLYHRRGPQSLGSVGPACPCCLGAEQAKLQLVNVRCSVRHRHDWDHYVGCSGILGLLGEYSFRPQLASATLPPPPTAAAVSLSENDLAAD
jgi:hypothetical protein